MIHLSVQIFKDWIGPWRGVALHHFVYGSWTQIWIMNMNYDDQVQASREYNHCPKTTNNLIARAAMIRIHNHSVYIHPSPRTQQTLTSWGCFKTWASQILDHWSWTSYKGSPNCCYCVFPMNIKDSKQPKWFLLLLVATSLFFILALLKFLSSFLIKFYLKLWLNCECSWL